MSVITPRQVRNMLLPGVVAAVGWFWELEIKDGGLELVRIGYPVRVALLSPEELEAKDYSKISSRLSFAKEIAGKIKLSNAEECQKFILDSYLYDNQHEFSLH